MRHVRLVALVLMSASLEPGAMTAAMSESNEQQVSSGLLEAHVRELAGSIGERNIFKPRALEAAAEYIDRSWRKQGYDVTYQTYEARGVESANLEVNRPGTLRPEEILLIGAHYDSVAGSPGADDNASGVAALLELSRLFAAIEPEITIRFVAFVNEEPPFFYRGDMGSRVYARAARARGDQIRLMVSIESIGYFSDRPGSQRYPPLFRFFYPDQGNFLAFVSNLDSRRWLRPSVEAFEAHSDLPTESVAMFAWVPGIGWSDHLGFWKEGYAALMATDTALYRTPYYHTAEDTPEKLDYASLTGATEGLFGTFQILSADELP